MINEYIDKLVNIFVSADKNISNLFNVKLLENDGHFLKVLEEKKEVIINIDYIIKICLSDETTHFNDYDDDEDFE